MTVDAEIADSEVETQAVEARSGDVEMPPLKDAFRNKEALSTTFDSLRKAPITDPTVAYLDETSKVLNQITSGTMDGKAVVRDSNMETLQTVLAQTQILVCTDADLGAEEVDFIKRHRGANGAEATTKNILYHNSYYRLDARFVPDRQQLKGDILRSVMAEKKNTVVACSTNPFTKHCGLLIQDYALGRIDLFANKVDRRCEEVITEVAGIHRCTCEEAIALLGRALNGCHYICGDTTPQMKKAKEVLLERSLAKEHDRKEEWQFDGRDWVKRTLTV